MKQRIKTALIKALIYIGIFAVIFAILAFILIKTIPDLLPLLEHGDQHEIESYIRSAGANGIFLACLLQVLQVISIIFPGPPIQVTAGIVYGTIKGFVICHLSYVAANICVFFVAKKLGSKIKVLAPNLSPSEKKLGKFRDILNYRHPAYMVFILCMFPLIPNGCIPYIAANTKINLKSFSIAVFFGSIPRILIFCAIGNHIMEREFAFAIFLFAIFFICLLLLIIFRNRILKVIINLKNKYSGKIVSKIKK